MGVEPTVADLQSAALATWLRRLTVSFTSQTIRSAADPRDYTKLGNLGDVGHSALHRLSLHATLRRMVSARKRLPRYRRRQNRQGFFIRPHHIRLAEEGKGPNDEQFAVCPCFRPPFLIAPAGNDKIGVFRSKGKDYG